MESITSKKYFIAGTAVAAILIGVFYKNYVTEKNFLPLDHQTVVKILKFIRKENYFVLHKVTMIVRQIAAMSPNPLPREAIEAQLNSPFSGMRIEEELQQNKEKAIAYFGTDIRTFTRSLELFAEDREIERIKDNIASDYETAIGGKVVRFDVIIPKRLTKEMLLQLIDRSAKETQLHQVTTFKKLKDYTEEDLRSNPELLKDIGSPDELIRAMLEEEGLGTDEEPCQAVFDAAVASFRGDSQFGAAARKINTGYQNIFKKYAYKMQAKTISERELDQLEEEIILFKSVIA